METIAVIALSRPGFWPLVGRIANECQRVIQIALEISWVAPLWSTIGFLLPIPAQLQPIPQEKGTLLTDDHPFFQRKSIPYAA
jgi:hypothetical protein